jgi:hypothetical protein
MCGIVCPVYWHVCVEAIGLCVWDVQIKTASEQCPKAVCILRFQRDGGFQSSRSRSQAELFSQAEQAGQTAFVLQTVRNLTKT